MQDMSSPGSRLVHVCDLSDIDPLPESAAMLDPVALVRSLAWARTVEDAIERMPPYVRDRMTPEAAADAIRAVVAYAAALTRDWRFLPPAEAAFLAELGVAASELAGLRARAGRLLLSFLEGDPVVAEATADDDRRAACYYAAALLKQQRAFAAIEKARGDAPMLDGALTGMDRKRVTDYLLSRSMGGTVETLERLMSSWRRLVDRVEGDHDSMTYDDYEQALIARDVLEVALSLMAPDARTMIEDQLRPLDKRFFAATEAVSDTLRPVSPWQPQRWWWFHAPSRPSQQLAAYIESVAPQVP